MNDDILESLYTIEEDINKDCTKILDFLSSRNIDIDKPGLFFEDENPSTKGTLLKRGVIQELTPLLEKEDFISGFIWSIDGSLIYENNKYTQAEDSIPRRLPEFTKKITGDLPKIVTVVKGTYVSFKMMCCPNPYRIHNMYEATHKYYGFYSINISEKVPSISKIFKRLKITAKEAKSWVLHTIINCAWEETPIPPMLYEGLPTSSFEEGIYKLPSGRYIYIPSKEVYEESTDSFLRILNGEDVKLKANSIIFIDKNKKVLATDSKANLVSFILSGIKPVSTIDKKQWLSKSTAIISSRTGSGLASSIHWLDTISGKGILSSMSREGSSRILYQESAIPIEQAIQEYWFQHLLDKLEDFGKTRYTYNSIIQWMTFLGGVKILKSCIGNVASIKTEIANQLSVIENTGVDSFPKLPSMKEGLISLHHQAEAVAKLNIAKDSAILDVATGGGKTITLLMDILNLLQQGVINRPLLCMPTTLVGQWVSEIKGFTEDINVIVVSTETINKYGVNEIKSICKTAPKNTIFITTYSFIRNDSEIIGLDFERTDIYTFPNCDLIQDIISPDYIALDESHFIKNSNSQTSKASCVLGTNARVKRIATGTLITNNPFDLVGQLQFIDPAIIGNPTEFAERYAKDGNPKNGWSDTFASDIRRDLRENTAYIMYREKDWAPLLPQREYSYNFIDMTHSQALVYKDLVKDVLEEINSNPKLRAAWEKMQEAGEELEGIPPQLLGKLARLEQYLTNPSTQSLLKHSSPLDNISCKIEKIDELIGKSLSSNEENNKVIVAVHYKKSASHLLQHSKYRDVSVYYDAGVKDNIAEFKNNPKVKVMFAVIQSITEGHNLQVANRVIIADVDWTPGKLKQLEARIFRPHVKIKDGKLQNLNANKKVFIDTVLANDSADVVKFSFQMYKKLLGANIMEDCPVPITERPGFDEESLTARFEDPIINGPYILETSNTYNRWLDAQIAERVSKGNLELQPIKVIKNGGTLGTETITKEPWVTGMKLPLKKGEQGLNSYLDKVAPELDTDNISLVPTTTLLPFIKGKSIRTEHGFGTVVGVTKNKIRVNVKNKGVVAVPPELIIISEDPDKAKSIFSTENKKSKDKTTKVKEAIVKKVTENVQPKTKKVTKPIKYKPEVELYPGSYNDIPVLIAYPEEEEYEDILEKSNFKYLGEFWAYEVPSRTRGLIVLEKLARKYNIPDRNYIECEKILNEMKRSKYPYEFPEDGVRHFLKLNKRKAPLGTLRIYPLIIDEEVHFVVDKDTHPSIKLGRYKFEVIGGCYMYIAVNISDLKRAWIKINKLATVTNRKEAIKLAKISFQIALP